MNRLLFIIPAFIVLLIAGYLNAEIIEVGAIDTPGDANDLVVVGDYAFVADNQAGLRIINITNPEEPVEVGFFDSPGTALHVAISGDDAYIADGPGGLCIVDISDPENPDAIGAFQGQLIINDVVVSGDYAYLADLIGGLRIIDISDPENPRQVEICETPDIPQGLFLADQLVYIADRRSGLQIRDISNPEDIAIVGSIDTPGEANAVFIQDNYAFIADKTHGLRIVDISDPSDPFESGSFDTDGLAIDVKIATNYAYIADGANGFLLLNVTDTENPGLLGVLDTPGTSYGIDLGGDYLYVADGGSGLKVLHLTPEILVSEEELDFGRVDIGESAEMTLTISNEGHSDLVVSDVVVDGLYFGCDFEDEVILQAHSNYEVIITFSPEWFGYLNGNLTILSNDLQNDEIRIPLNGHGNLNPNIEKITAGDAESDDYFGISVSVSGDFAVVGAHCNDDDGANSGSAYVFAREGDNWIQQSMLVAEDGDEEDRFGWSVSISGDYAIVGAYFNNDNGQESGSAYIFVRDGDEWTQQAKLNADDADGGDVFGISVSVSGDFAVVGAHCNDDDGANSGSAYVFAREGDNWIQQAKLIAEDAAEGDYFGGSVSNSDDLTLVGAYGDDDDGNWSGSAYIFVHEGNRWTQQAKLTANDAAESAYFGTSVSIDGDQSIIGSYLNDDGGALSGSAYIFVRDGDNWNQQIKLTADDAAEGDRFGKSVSIDGNCAIVGASATDDNGDYSGSAYIFTIDGNDWTLQAKLNADDATEGDYFGSSVSISGNYSIVGAYGNDDDGDHSGSAYICSIEYPDQPSISANQDALDFGTIMVGSNSEFVLTISNVGELDLLINEISVIGEGFNIDFEGEFVIESGGNEEVIVTFAPEERGEYNGTLIIVSNDPFLNEISIELTGFGIPASTVLFSQNWNLISINIYPPQEFYQEGEDRGADVIRMMEQLRIDEENHHVLLMKNEDGRFYLPAFDFNNIPYWDLTEGYQVKVDEDVEAVWAGDRIPADADIPLEENWNFIAYYPTYELDATAPDFYVLSPIIDHVLIAKDGDGNFMLPAFNFSNMPPWRETQGYQVRVDAEVTLNYPAVQEEVAFNPHPYSGQNILGNDHWTVNPTGQNMSVLVTTVFGIDPAVNNQVAAFNSDGQVIGTGSVSNDGICGLAVWGDDESTDQIDGLLPGESFTLKLWDAKREKELTLTPITTLEGAGLIYEPDGLTALEMATETAVPEEFFLSEAYPNPFNASVRLGYGLPEPSDVTINVYDISGRSVTTLTNGKLTAGFHSVVWDGSATASGIYFIRMSASEFKSVRKVTLLK
jgi:hypothetical protein